VLEISQENIFGILKLYKCAKGEWRNCLRSINNCSNLKIPQVTEIVNFENNRIMISP